MKVYAFFGPVEGKQIKDEEALLDFWMRNWRAEGWDPVVLTPSDLVAAAVSVRYSNSAMKPEGMEPRHEWIPRLRPSKFSLSADGGERFPPILIRPNFIHE